MGVYLRKGRFVMNKIGASLFLITVILNTILDYFGLGQNIIKIWSIIILSFIYFYYLYRNSLFKKKLYIFFSLAELYIMIANFYVLYKHHL